MNRKMVILMLSLSVFLALFVGCDRSVSVLKSEEETREIEDTGQSEDDEEETPDKIVVQEDKIFVDVSGAVALPGVYQLPYDARVFQAIEAAGGYTEDARVDLINQAEVVRDGQKIYVYTKQEAEQIEMSGIQSMDKNTSKSDKININRASKDELMLLPGIGETRADAILSYREEHGTFASAEELMNVEGIKEKIYEKLKDKITAN